MSKFYITTTLPYVNAEPHVGFAMEIVRADVVARTYRLRGDEVFFNTGTDEHGQKIYEKAKSLGIETKEYCDQLAERFKNLKSVLNLSYDAFTRTTDEHHLKAAQEFWRRCVAKGDIYKKLYKVKYCVGCELEKTDSELVEGRCPLHPNVDLELIEEENYFFKFSNYQEVLLKLYAEQIEFIKPSFRQKEIEAFVRNGLADFSISRLKAKMPWGIEVPDDPEQVMYVWFDALTNYITCLGWPENEEKFRDFWPGVQFCGKDNLRQQTAMWQAMLMSAGLPTSKQIMVGGFILANGVKMSKSLGNTIDPVEYAEKYGVDALRYFLVGQLAVYEDSDMTKERFESSYQANLANGIGNLCARVAAMAEREDLYVEPLELMMTEEVSSLILSFDFDKAVERIWERIRETDLLINQREVWKMEGEEKKAILMEMVKSIRQIGADLQTIMPQTAEKILSMFNVGEIKKGEPLFLRLETKKD